MYYTSTIDWFHKNEISYLNNVVQKPEYFQPTALPRAVKDLIRDKNNNKFIETHNENDDLLFDQFVVKIKEQDRLKQINIKDYLPEFYNIVKGYMND
jgi:hypothetical protein